MREREEGVGGGGQLYQHVLHIFTCRSDVYDSWGKPKTDSKSSVVVRVCVPLLERAAKQLMTVLSVIM